MVLEEVALAREGFLPQRFLRIPDQEELFVARSGQGIVCRTWRGRLAMQQLSNNIYEQALVPAIWLCVGRNIEKQFAIPHLPTDPVLHEAPAHLPSTHRRSHASRLEDAVECTSFASFSAERRDAF